ncbi:thioester reductase domain-containing protein [Streptomyces sp. NPDC001928]|uniref:thioester reductase domain-containing protein n=1 Tax=Streptomyces sp. NPDC001928 TaxID=3154404 RepID=UPI00332F67D7
MLLLTGATGFLGSRLCAELLRRTHRDIACLVRADSAEDAERRVRARLQRQDSDVASYGLLRCVPGDFTRPFFGLAAGAWRQLGRQVTEVYHCGASVNMAAPYEYLEPVNVDGTARVLEFCQAAGVERLHHVSTLGVFLSARRTGMRVVGEDAVPSAATCSEIGYPRSKYEAELLVLQAAARGLAVRLYRPGVVLADSRSGACPTDDFTARLLAAMVASGVFPRTGNVLRTVAADHAAQQIAALSLAADADGVAFPVTGPEPFPTTEFWHQARSFGYRIQATTPVGWSAALKAQGPRRPALAMRALGISRYLLGLDEDAVLPDFGCEPTTRLAADLGVVSPPMDTAYFARMFTHLIEHGVIHGPLSDGESP